MPLFALRTLLTSAALVATLPLGLAGCATDDGSDTKNPGTYETCTTTIASDVPDFYKTYFRCVSISMSNGAVVISSDGLPPHKSYYYGSAHALYTAFDTSRGAAYHPNPNVLKEQSLSITIPASPKARGLTIDSKAVDGTVGGSNEYRLGSVGIALDGVALFNPLAAPGDDIEDEKYTFDSYNAHPNDDGTYHYHTVTKGPLELLKTLGLASSDTPGQADIEVYGVMCDGTVLLGCKELDGSAVTASGLDAQNGHVHDIKDKAGTVHFAGRYHAHVCETVGTHKFTPELQYYDTCK